VEVYEKILAAGGLPVIVDAGANVGAASIWFATEFPGACILAVEPDPGNAAICRRNTQRFPAVNVIEAAIGSKQGTVRLTNPSNQAWMVQTVRGDNGSIPICTISEIVRNAGKSAQLFIVKIDIEGFEDDLFQNDTQWIREAVVVMIEPHDWLFPGRGTSLNFQKILANEEYEILISGENLIYVRLLERGFPNS
jgi:FkbM family methyltransferase